MYLINDRNVRVQTTPGPYSAGLEQLTGASAIEPNKINTSPLSVSVGNQPVTGSVVTLPTITSYDNGNRSRSRKQFFITLSFGFKPTETDKLLVVNNLEISENKIIAYCIAIERSCVSIESEYHIHCFVEYSENLSVSELCKYLRCIYLDCKSIDVQPCRSKKSTLKYITKEDVLPLTNISLLKMHMNVRVYHWASNASKFDSTDPFVVEHRFCYRFLERYWGDFQKNSIAKFKGLRLYEGNEYNNWQKECVTWWNDYIHYIKTGCKGFKKGQLYLWGGTNTGKSSLVESLIGKQNLKFCFYPGIGKFFMQGFDPFYHKVIVFEEFNIRVLQRLLLEEIIRRA